MQSLCARRRVKSGGRGDEGFWVRLAVGDSRRVVRGGHGWVRAEYEHDKRAEEEAGDNIVAEFVREELL